jgi:hypothetical protein
MLVVLALLFDFMNGFHDAANSIATVVSTGVLKPQQAVLFAAFFNVVAIFVFQLKVAATIGKGIVVPGVVDQHVVFGALIGAIAWNVITWWYGIPSSSSHALIGGIVGATVAKAGTGPLVASGRAQDRGLHLRLAGAGLPAGLAADGGGGLDLPANVAAAGGQLVPAAAAGVGRPVLAGPRRQRRAEDHRHHLAAADRGRHQQCQRQDAADLGDLELLHRHRPGHDVRRLAHRQDHGPAHHQAQAGGRLLRRDGRCDHAVPGHRAGHAGVDHAHHHRRHLRRRVGAQRVRRALGPGRQHRLAWIVTIPATAFIAAVFYGLSLLLF